MTHTLRKQLFNWKRTALTACAALLPLAASAQGQGLHVFACEPEWAALVKALAKRGAWFMVRQCPARPGRWG